MKISHRLKKLSECLTPNTVIADIGSDHGYLCVYYMRFLNGKKAYACDINQNALNQAKNTLAKNEPLNIELQLMNGIQHLKQDVKEIVIAGMGFDTIRSILTNQEAAIEKLNKIVIQCNKNLDKLQEFLQQIGLHINETHLVCENALFYEIYVCSKKEEVRKAIEEDTLYQDYILYLMKKIERTPNFETIHKLKQKYEQLKQKRNS